MDTEDASSRQVARMVTGLGVQYFQALSFAAGYLCWYKACDACDQDGSFGPNRYRPGHAYLRDQGPLDVIGWSWFGTGAYRVTRGEIQRIADPGWEVVAAKRVRD